MPTEAQREADRQVNNMALALCEIWQAEQRRTVAIDELSAFMAGVVAAEAYIRGHQQIKEAP